jgi:hypothetical protein
MVVRCTMTRHSMLLLLLLVNYGQLLVFELLQKELQAAAA